MLTLRGLTGSILTIVLISLPGLATAATRHVGAGQTYATIQAAVDASSPGDSIVIHDGTYVENVTVDRALAIVSQDYLDNGEYDSAILDAGSNYMSALTVLSGLVSVEGLSFTGKPLRELKLPQDCLIGSVVREKKTFIPHGDDRLLPGDKIVVFCLARQAKKVNKYFL